MAIRQLLGLLLFSSLCPLEGNVYGVNEVVISLCRVRVAGTRYRRGSICQWALVSPEYTGEVILQAA